MAYISVFYHIPFFGRELFLLSFSITQLKLNFVIHFEKKFYALNSFVIRRGYDIVMTTSLSSDVPVGYFSWAEYDIMAPVQPKTEKALAAAFISNCAARNFRLQALEGLENENITIDSYGGCHRNRDGRGVVLFITIILCLLTFALLHCQ